MLDILVLNWIYVWEYLLTLIFNQENQSDTSTLNLEESWGDSPEPFTENSATRFGYTLCVCIIVLVCKISFNFALALNLISLSPIHPPSRWLIIGISAWCSWFGSNNLELKILFQLITIFCLHTHGFHDTFFFTFLTSKIGKLRCLCILRP